MRFFVLLVVITAGTSTVAFPQTQPPNIILIMADDQGYGDYGFTGNPVLRTPNLDTLAKQSMVLTDFYVAPVCAPTRASLLTGRYHQRTGVRSVTNGYETMAPDETTMAEYLKSIGYHTGLFGKWHLGENYPSVPHAQGFDEFLGFRTGHLQQYFDPELEEKGTTLKMSGYVTDVFTDAAIAFIRKHKDDRFFCYIPYNAPHTPLDVPAKYWEPYRKRGFDEDVARVYGMMENLDENVGRILREVKRLSLESNTLIVYLSDNGPIFRRNKGQLQKRYNAGLRDMKFSVYEGGIKTPVLFYWKGRIIPGTNSTPAAHIDLLPTILGLAEYTANRVKPLDGKSLAPLLLGTGSVSPDRYLFLNYSLATLENPAPYPGGVVRTAHFKMVNGTELYDMASDPGESENLADQHPRILQKLDSMYRQWWSEVHERGFDPLPIPVGHPEETTVSLAPHLGKAYGELKFLGMRGNADHPVIRPHPVGVDSDWISNWRSRGDSIRWRIHVVTPSTYEVRLIYRNFKNAAMPMKWVVTIGDGQVIRELPASKVDQWTELKLGSMELTVGDYVVTLSSPDVNGAEPEVERVLVERR